MSGLVQVQDLRKSFRQRGKLFAAKTSKLAVDGVTFSIRAKSTLALVGESGSGKSTVGLMVLKLLQPTSGVILFGGDEISTFRGNELMAFRRQVQVVFQDPYASLNARMQVREIVTEGMAIHGIGATHSERESRAESLLSEVGLSGDALDRYPHEFSGGQRQRIAIARALSIQPKFIVLDEPTSALDVSVQSQVLNLLRSLQTKHGLTYLFITHNLGVVEYMADDVCVMQAGKIVEQAPTEQLFDSPNHPYTQKLLSAIPSPDPSHRTLLAKG